MQDICVERGIAAFPYYGLAAGFPTGKYTQAPAPTRSTRLPPETAGRVWPGFAGSPMNWAPLPRKPH